MAGFRKTAPVPPSDEHLAGLRILTPRLELRIPTDADIEALCALARLGIHDPAVMPFDTPWTDTPDAEFHAQFQSFHAQVRASWGTPAWDYEFVVSARDRSNITIGTQGLAMRGEPLVPETGSWLGQQFQGQGYGTEMRAAVLSYAFDVLGLAFVTSGAYTFNVASHRVSEKMGYVETHRVTKAPRGVPQESVRYRIDREQFAARRPDLPIEFVGSAPVVARTTTDADPFSGVEIEHPRRGP
ncbi:MAG: GNAT family N-acetyltransferase [Acidimicrobiia bacterium]